MASNYTGNPTAVQAPASAPGPGVALIVSLPADTDGASWANLYQEIRAAADYITYLTQSSSIIAGWWGDGSDGAATLDGTNTVAWASKSGSVYTMTRDAALTNLTVTGAGTILKTAGYRLRGTGTLTTASSGVVSNDGTAGGTPTAGTGAPAGTLAGGSTGGAGGLSGGGAPTAGTNFTGFGGAGGAGGAGTGGAGAAAGTETQPAANLGNPNALAGPFFMGYLLGLSGGTPTLTSIAGGSGGGGGGRASGATDSGGGGGGGGCMVIAFRKLSLAAAGDIHCSGGAGGPAGVTNGGGGGGGGGGVLLLSYAVNVNSSAFSAATNCPGGAGGTTTGGTVGAVGSNGTLYNYGAVAPA